MCCGNLSYPNKIALTWFQNQFAQNIALCQIPGEISQSKINNQKKSNSHTPVLGLIIFAAFFHFHKNSLGLTETYFTVLTSTATVFQRGLVIRLSSHGSNGACRLLWGEEETWRGSISTI